MVQPMGSQRVGQDLATEQQQQWIIAQVMPQSFIYLVVELFTVLFLMYSYLFIYVTNSQASRELDKSAVLPTSCPLGLQVLPVQRGQRLVRSQRLLSSPVLCYGLSVVMCEATSTWMTASQGKKNCIPLTWLTYKGTKNILKSKLFCWPRMAKQWRWGWKLKQKRETWLLLIPSNLSST